MQEEEKKREEAAITMEADKEQRIDLSQLKN
jgi:hypothetical protein